MSAKKKKKTIGNFVSEAVGLKDLENSNQKMEGFSFVFWVKLVLQWIEKNMNQQKTKNVADQNILATPSFYLRLDAH